jgi:nicotinamide mononucleotide transporter
MLDDCLQYIAQNKLEVFVVILSILGVWLTAKEKIITWPVGIVSCAVYAYIFFKDALYGDSSLQVFYVLISFYGWYEWLYGGEKDDKLHISKASVKTLILLLILCIPSTILIRMLLSLTNSNTPYLDSITTALSLAATWMMAKKLIENWLVWIFTDAIYVALYIIKHLYLTSLLYFIFTLLAVYGYYVWKKQIKPSYA